MSVYFGHGYQSQNLVINPRASASRKPFQNHVSVIEELRATKTVLAVFHIMMLAVRFLNSDRRWFRPVSTCLAREGHVSDRALRRKCPSWWLCLGKWFVGAWYACVQGGVDGITRWRGKTSGSTKGDLKFDERA
jgi:hypothetical protein